MVASNRAVSSSPSVAAVEADAAPPRRLPRRSPDVVCGCDTFVAFPPTAPPGWIVFGKNSDRPQGEGQTIQRYPRTTYYEEQEDPSSNPAQPVLVQQCTYISIPQVATTHAVLLSQIDWMWGAEMGANEHGVVIGNEAVWTCEPCDGRIKALLGMDLVRLGLERGRTAAEAMRVVTELLEEFGQSGPCAENDPSFTYHNSFLIVDSKEAWIVETAGRQWAAQRYASGAKNISNCLSIRANYDACSEGLKEYAEKNGYPIQLDDQGRLDFTAAFCTGTAEEETTDPRYCGGQKLLREHEGKGSLDRDAMISILRSHSCGICMHGGFETTCSWVSEIPMSVTTTTSADEGRARHWSTGKPHPCRSAFEEHPMHL